jgi:hypothetical protein
MMPLSAAGNSFKLQVLFPWKTRIQGPCIDSRRASQHRKRANDYDADIESQHAGFSSFLTNEKGD